MMAWARLAMSRLLTAARGLVALPWLLSVIPFRKSSPRRDERCFSLGLALGAGLEGAGLLASLGVGAGAGSAAFTTGVGSGVGVFGEGGAASSIAPNSGAIVSARTAERRVGEV